MKNRDGIVATLAVALTTVALAGVISTDAYLQTAKAEVQGVRALTDVASGQGQVAAAAGNALMAADTMTVTR
ncbi:hypothetical protein ASF61_08345 [Duganella sp. Leaf126]|uniref:hypothetical protein n=1 Tax=Duganella sp. Leaf126 TaxID=1736266 RepID=UPI0006F9AE75|nr:hypothetical protein [Duganella sp. Leaf126]KQQ36195.1 hypothetical protein ASF61_08345 [Duganella sp. Leaf126]